MTHLNMGAHAIYKENNTITLKYLQFLMSHQSRINIAWWCTFNGIQGAPQAAPPKSCSLMIGKLNTLNNYYRVEQKGTVA